MRFLLLAAFSFAFIGGGNALAADDETAKEDYALEAYEQSLKAYQLCAARNSANPQNCSALARVIEADKKRFEMNNSGF
ncbi:hypothetical protein [Methylocystis sp. ATCC 49242]|uniref:hypothetical protein n=1 Tax=Methylocystis sp. ATCC 49242 TaxID=622637 RepID=UPI0001F86D2A|nr:hypothetical protein [Methylocystis sp. ATCC 49242]